MDKKKKKEYQILRALYPESVYKDITLSEKPDFIIKDEAGELFGVEITEYYQNQTSGRFNNIPDYVNKIINKTYIHKNDIGILEVPDSIEILGDDGKWTPVGHKGVLQTIPQSTNRIQALKDLVKNKSSKYLNYNKSLSAIDLVIYDHGDLVAGLDIQKTQILEYLRKQELANTLVSPFRNITLVINDPTRQIIFKLKSDKK